MRSLEGECEGALEEGVGRALEGECEVIRGRCEEVIRESVRRS